MEENNKENTEDKKVDYIGVKDLGHLKKEDFCARCFWYERHFGPFPGIFPGVFNVIDKNLKSSVWERWKKERKLPFWLKVENVKGILTADKIGEIEERYRQKYLISHHPESQFTLRGTPDLILELEDGTIHIIDFKTGRFKEEGDEFLPIYEVQLNGYAFLTTKKQVSKLSLVYFNPTNEIPEEIFTQDIFKLDFRPKIVEVEIKTNLVEELLIQARQILDLEEPPPAKANCKGTCFYIEKLKLSSFKKPQK